MRVALLLLALASPALAGGEIYGHNHCTPTTLDDCQAGLFATSKAQCPWMANLVCVQFEKPAELCYGLRNPNGCIDGSGSRHFKRPIANMTPDSTGLH